MLWSKEGTIEGLRMATIQVGVFAIDLSEAKHPSVRPMTESRAVGPEFNEIEISQRKGYEIDDGVWEHA